MKILISVNGCVNGASTKNICKIYEGQGVLKNDVIACLEKLEESNLIREGVLKRYQGPTKRLETANVCIAAYFPTEAGKALIEVLKKNR